MSYLKSFFCLGSFGALFSSSLAIGFLSPSSIPLKILFLTLGGTGGAFFFKSYVENKGYYKALIVSVTCLLLAHTFLFPLNESRFYLLTLAYLNLGFGTMVGLSAILSLFPKLFQKHLNFYLALFFAILFFSIEMTAKISFPPLLLIILSLFLILITSATELLLKIPPVQKTNQTIPLRKSLDLLTLFFLTGIFESWLFTNYPTLTFLGLLAFAGLFLMPYKKFTLTIPFLMIVSLLFSKLTLHPAFLYLFLFSSTSLLPLTTSLALHTCHPHTTIGPLLAFSLLGTTLGPYLTLPYLLPLSFLFLILFSITHLTQLSGHRDSSELRAKRRSRRRS